MIDAAITTIIKSQSAITTLISDRLYPLRDIAEGLPAIYYRVRLLPDYNKNGQQEQNWKISMLTIGKTYAQAWTLAMLLKKAFDANSKATVSGVKFIQSRCTAIYDEVIEATDGYVVITEIDSTIKTINA